MNKNISILMLILMLPVVFALSARADNGQTVRIAVLPFEVYSAEKKGELGTDVAARLAAQLRTNPAIVTPDLKAVQSVVREADYGLLSEQRLKELSKVLDANFVVLGSITNVGAEYSVDVQMFNTLAGAEYLKTFAEGTQIDVLIAEVARKLSAEAFAKANLIPPAQQVTMTAGAPAQRPAAPQTAGTELDLAAVLGLPETAGQPAPKEPAPERSAGAQPAAPMAQSAEEPPPLPLAEPQITAAALPDDNATARRRASRPKQPREAAYSFDKPIKINADSMEYDNKRNRALFSGNVVARQGDVTMFADSMEVLYAEQGKLDQFAASGNVKVIQGDRIATGQRIVFYNSEQKIVATGSPRVWQGDNVINGHKIIVYLKEDRYVVESSPESRASASIYPQKKKP